MQTIPVSEGQTNLDIAMQGCGDVSAAFDISLLNEISLTDDLPIGKEMIVPDIVNPLVVQVFSHRHLIPASMDTSFAETAVTEGIEFWAIELDFIVS